MPPLGHPLRARAIGLYKEYPDPNYHFLPKLRAMFRKNAHLTDDKEIESKLALAEFVKRETESADQILGVPPTASQEAIKKAYQRESLRSHPDRFPNATPDETRAHTQRFQSVADACTMRAHEGYASGADDASTQDESARFFRTFGGGGTNEQPQAQGLFADVLEEMLRPEVERHCT
ncbi:hypothetical protein MCAP1_001736 [Malassezia caprae]|uniref:J domain-containing protein n=1 Tax=Malassezia caprae TaxID=1381934 RepID=A0AAF0E6T1_9BASI|nr:hypothetical protein MCAP1_001736 [Malassezia caprae]